MIKPNIEKIVKNIMSGNLSATGLAFKSNGEFFYSDEEYDVEIFGHLFNEYGGGVFLVVGYCPDSFLNKEYVIRIKSADGMDFMASNSAPTMIPVTVRADISMADKLKNKYLEINDNYEELLSDINIGMSETDLDSKYRFSSITNNSYSLERKK